MLDDFIEAKGGGICGIMDGGYINSEIKAKTIDSLSKNIIALRKIEFDKVTTKTIQLNKTQVYDELNIVFIKSANVFKNSLLL